MKILFYGLNVALSKADSFELEDFVTIDQTTIETIRDLSNFYISFDTIYYWSQSRKVIFELNTESRKLEPIITKNFIDVSVNTNHLWCLTCDNNVLELLQYTGRDLVSSIRLNNINSSESKLLRVISTDINVYLFENSDASGLKCLHNVNESNDEKRASIEIQLNEKSTCSLPIGQLIDQKCRSISHGKEHLLFLTGSQLFSAGVGLKGQLGTGRIENSFDRVQAIECGKSIECVESGGWHAGWIDSEGRCFMWGWNSCGQIAASQDNDSAFVTHPTQIQIRNEHGEVKFKRMSLGSRHSALISTRGELYVFGWNKYGQILVQNELDYEDQVEIEPQKIDWLADIQDVKCGNWQTLILI